MAVDITPSLKNGKMEKEMRSSICNNYRIAYNDKGTKEPYFYINRNNPGAYTKMNVTENAENAAVLSLCTKMKKYDGGFSYKSDVDMRHYFVENPRDAGAVGITVPMPNSLGKAQRTMIVSGELSGCGFAVLINKGKDVLVIHAGGATNDTQPKLQDEQRRRIINRDICLMVYALAWPGDYENNPYKTMIGVDYQEFFNFLSSNYFQGFVYVQGDKDLIYFNPSNAELQFRLYNNQLIHDVVCVINEGGELFSAIRTMDGSKVKNVYENELYRNIKPHKKPESDNCIIM